MDVNCYTTTRNGENVTRVEISTGGYVACQAQNFRVFNSNGTRIIKTSDYGAGSKSYSFYLEDYPDLINIHTTSASITFTVEHHQQDLEVFGIGGYWRCVDTKGVTCTINNNSYTRPTLTMNTTEAPQTNGYNMKGATKIQASFSGAAKYGASIKSYVLRVEGKDYTASGGVATSDPFSTSGNVTITGIVTDSRGFTNSVSKTVTVLNNLPLLNSFTSNTGYVDGVISYSFTPPVSLYYSKVRIDSLVDGVASEVCTETIGASSGAVSKTLSFIDDQLKKIYERYPATVNTKLKMTLLTYKDSDYSSLMSEQPTLELDLKIPQNDSTKPKIDSISCVPSVVLLGKSDLFVQGKNGINTTITATGQYKTSIVSMEWTLGSNTYQSGNSSAVLNASGTVTITATVVDQRGFSRSQTANVNYEPYLMPAVVQIDGQTAVYVERESGESIDKLKVAAAKRFSSLAGNNRCELRCRLKVGMNGTYGDYIALLESGSASNSYDQVSSIEIDKDEIYYVELSVIDALNGTGSIVLAIPSEAVFMDRDGVNNSIAFGGYVDEPNAFQVYQSAFFRGGMYIDDISAGTRYKITIGEGGQLIATEERMTFSLRR